MKHISIILKSLVAICAFVGVLLSLFKSGFDDPAWNIFLFFTIQSNIWIAIVCLVGIFMMLHGRKSGSISRSAVQSPGRVWSVVKLVFTISITLTGMVYCFMLAPTIEGNPFTIDSVLLHVCAPLFSIVDFFVCGRWYDLKLKDSLWVALPPLYYLIFASIGYVCNWNFTDGQNYPYFFVNWGSPLGAFGLSSSFPFMGVIWYVVALLAALWLFGLAYIALCTRSR